ncbi:MAG: restriction endonuclease subunit S [Burkholderiales bacterium]|nr:restriction endonuclease subunit S [Burkholderiales bacterium]
MRDKAEADDMPTDDKPALVPKLRFPEFRDAPSWEKIRLGNNLNFQPGFPFASSGFNDTGKGPRLIRNRDLRSDDIMVFYSDTFDDSFIVNNGDVLVGMDGDFTPIIWTKGKALLNQRVGRIHPRADNDRRFLYYLLTLCLKKIEEQTARTTVKHLSHSTLEEQYEPLARPAEQLKIAECLSSLDEAIAAQARKVDALKKHKKGLMQQLFPREGETQPRLRFPEFRDTGEWRVRRVSQFARVTTGDKDTQNKACGGEYPFFVRSQTVERIDSYSYDGEAVLTSGDGVGVGKNFHYMKGKFDFHQRVYCIFEFSDDVSGQFFYFYFSQQFGERVTRMSAKNSVDSVRMAMITDMPILLPPLPEQHKIVLCLSSLDSLIIAGAEKLEALKIHKKGLMQQLFPSRAEDNA